MASVEITISGVLIDKYGRTARPVTLVGEAVLTGLGVGGGPIYPPEGGGGENPPGIWGPTDPFPTPPIYLPPELGGGRPPSVWPPPGRPAHPIVLPPEQVPPGFQPPTPPAPGSPTTPVPPPPGSGGWPVAPITPPAYLVVQYPGIGPVYVAPPLQPSQPTPAGTMKR